MEVHSVLPEERARDENGNILPWGYRYMKSAAGAPGLGSDHADSSNASSPRNPRPAAEESGPFGKNRSARHTGSRNSRARTGTTPVRQKENPTVAEFGRLFAKEQKEEEGRPKGALGNPASGDAQHAASAPEAVATECLLYGYASKPSEGKVLSKFERIVAPSYICEDYPRQDTTQDLASPDVFSRSVVVHRELTKDALRKSRVYRGGDHWIKVTFNNSQAAERACYYSPQEIEGHLVFCEMWQGRAPFSDAPLIKGSHSANEHQRNANSKLRNLTTSESNNLLKSGIDSAVAGFERATQTLPRSFTAQDVQYGQPREAPPPTSSIITTAKDDTYTPSPNSHNSSSSTTASSATATATDTRHPTTTTSPPTLRSRSTPNLDPDSTNPTTQTKSPKPSSLSSEYMTAMPTVRKATLHPISSALLPQPSLSTRILRRIPILSWFVATTSTSSSSSGGGGGGGGGGKISSAGVAGAMTPQHQDWLFGDGPLLMEDGGWDEQGNGWYWWAWWMVDRWVGTDFCGVRED